MATVQVHESGPQLGRRPEEKTVAEVAMAGSLLEGVGGVAAVALAIIALAGVYPLYLVAIATIVLGASLLFEGFSIVARYSHHIMPEDTAMSATHTARMETGGGVSAEMFCGAAGVALGILALIGLVPWTLMAISAIALGAGLVLSSGTRARVRRHMLEGFHMHEFTWAIVREGMQAALITEVCVGIGAIVLGILALCGTAPVVLTTVAMLALGCGVFLGGVALSSRLVAFMHR